MEAERERERERGPEGMLVRYNFSAVTAALIHRIIPMTKAFQILNYFHPTRTTT